MRTFLCLLALGLGLMLARPAAAQTPTPNPLVTQTIGSQGSGSSWLTGLTLPRMRFESLFSPFRIISTPSGNTSTFVNPSTNQMEYLKQFGYSRPGRH